MSIKRGAGIIPFALSGGQIHFLFHKTFSGRRAGLLVDFGGGSLSGETQHQTAAREFVEETEAMFLNDHPEDANLSLHAESQIQVVLNLLQNTQRNHPDWWCQRLNVKGKKPKEWKTFFVEVEYKTLNRMNRLWEVNPQQLFKKRRELIWLTSDRLLDICINQPEKLWTRVRELDNAVSVIRSIEINSISSTSTTVC
ncbi:MAG: hypothetical protein ABFS39_12325 [Pseudomonadota bacterium]